MVIKFNEIKMQNFMCFRGAEITFDDKGFVLVKGINNNKLDNAKSNGSGKSTIWEAIVWGLTGDTIRGTKVVESNFANKELTSVDISFVCDERDIRLIRTKNPSNLKLYIDGEDKSGKGIRDTSSILSEYLPDLNSELLGSVIILGQGMPSRFSNNTPVGRKEILERLTKSDFMIEDIKSRLSSRKLKLQGLVNEYGAQKLVNEKEIELNSKELENIHIKLNGYENDNIRDLKEIEDEINHIDTLIEGKESESSSIKAELEKLNSNKYLLLENKTKDIDCIKDVYNSTYQSISKKIVETDVEINRLKKEIERFNNFTGVCPTCGQEVEFDLSAHEVETLSQSLDEYTKVSDELKSQLSLSKEQYSKELSTIEDTYKNKVKKIDEDTQKYQQEISNITSLVDTYKSSKSSLSNEYIYTKMRDDTIRELKSSEINLNKCIEDSKNKIKEVEDGLIDSNERLDIINKMSTIATHEFRGYLLNNIITYIDGRLKEFAKEIFNNDDIHFILDGNNISIIYGNREYDQLSGGEKQKIDIIIQFAIRDMLCKYLNFDCNLLVIDEVFDNLDDIGCGKIVDFINSRLNTISTIYVVTHRGGELNIPYDNVIQITKDCEGVSTLNVI